MLPTLKDLFGARVSFDPAILEAHGRDSGYPEVYPPEAVVFAEAVEDVQNVLAWCRTHRMPLIPFGVGSSLEGHITPQAPAISLDLSRMNRVLEVRPHDFLVAVEPGGTREELNRTLQRSYLEKPALFLEFHSSTRTAIEEESIVAEKLMRDAGALDITVAKNEQERSDQWEARHNFGWAFDHCYPGCIYYTTDTAVPVSRVTALVHYAQQLLKEMRLVGSIVGHIGDGNFHTSIATPPDAYANAEAYSSLLVKRALELGGTATGEHGVGLVKRKFMEAEHSAALEWMRQIKALFDPEGILNPGKIV